jgi:hypothetical protein
MRAHSSLAHKLFNPANHTNSMADMITLSINNISNRPMAILNTARRRGMHSTHKVDMAVDTAKEATMQYTVCNRAI